MHNNLEHVLKDDCTDEDCELHHIVVAAGELVISETELAFWFAGAMFQAKNPTMAGVELARAIEAMSSTTAQLDNLRPLEDE